MLLMIIILIILFVILIYHHLYYIIQHNENDNYHNIVYNKCYINITIEAYSKNPNIEKEIKCILQIHKDKRIPIFFIIDSIRLYAKSIRMSNLTDILKYSDGDIGTYYYQMKHYHQLIYDFNKKKRISNICEVGFQLGVGAITLITSVYHNVNYYGFDYGKKYSRNSYNILSKYFTMKITWGDSKITIPNFSSLNKNFEKCDVIHIDACHSQNAIYNDILNMKNISHHKSLLLLDDVDINSYSIKRAILEGIITDVYCFNKPYCIAEYV